MLAFFHFNTNLRAFCQMNAAFNLFVTLQNCGKWFSERFKRERESERKVSLYGCID